jgi:hypothetical protein
MQKIDLRQQYEELYKPSSEAVSIVEVPELSFLMMHWETDPGSEAFSLGVAALHSVGQMLRVMVKRELSISYRTMPVEILWWEGQQAGADPHDGRCTVMMMQPEYVTEEMVEKAKRAVQEKEELPASPIRLERFEEGKAVQILRRAAPTEVDMAQEKLQQYMSAHQLKPHGRHHEIYLSDLLMSTPEKLEVIDRQPVEG